MKYSNLIKFIPIIPALLYSGHYIIMSNFSLFTTLCYADAYILLLYCFKLLAFNKNETIYKETRIIKRCSKVYSKSIITRYVYYGLSQLFYKTICLLFYTSYIPIIKYVFVLTLIPKILNYILTSKLFENIITFKESVTKIISAKLLSLIIKYGSAIYLNMTVTIDVNELMPIFNNYDNTKKILGQVLINVAILLVLALIKFFSPNNYYYKVATLIYNYKLGDNLESIVIEKSNNKQINDYKKQIINIITNKEWKKLIEANSLKIMYQLYVNRDNNTNDFDKFVQNVFISNFWVSIIWSLSGWALNISDSLLIVPLISLYVLFMRENTINVIKLLTIIGGGFSGYFTNSLFLTCFLCEFSYILLINRITLNIIKFIFEKIKEFTHKIYFQNYKYIIYNILTTLTYLNTFDSNAFFVNIIINILHIALLNFDNTLLFIQFMHLFFGYFSNYSITHILCISTISYILSPFINLINIESMLTNTLPLIINKFKKKPKISPSMFIIDEKIFQNDNFIDIITTPVLTPIIENYVDKINVKKNDNIIKSINDSIIEDYLDSLDNNSSR